MCADNVKFAMSNVKLLSYFAPVKSPPPARTCTELIAKNRNKKGQKSVDLCPFRFLSEIQWTICLG